MVPAVATRREASGRRRFVSRTMRSGETPASPGSRTVSSGSSASAVPMPTAIASAWLRSRWTRAVGILPGDPQRTPTRPGDLAVGGERHLHRDRRPAAIDARDVAEMRRESLVGQHFLGHGEAIGAQHVEASPADARVGIAQRSDDAGDAGAGKRVGARPGAAVMRARLERDIGRGAACQTSGLSPALRSPHAAARRVG